MTLPSNSSKVEQFMMTAYSFQLDVKIHKCLGYVYSLSGHQLEHAPAMLPCSKTGQWPTWLH